MAKIKKQPLKTRSSSSTPTYSGNPIQAVADAINGVGRDGNPNRRDWSDTHSDGLPVAPSDIQALLGSGSTYDKFLGLLGKGGTQDNELLQLILQVAAGNQGALGTHQDDLQLKLIDMYLQQLQKNEQRSFDKGALEEQRVYDNPTSQLARLMGAGVSRDAAIQLLGQGGESPLVGSGADVGNVTETPSPTQTTMQALQTASGVLSTIGSLVGLGFSIPQAIQQTHFLKNQNLLNDRQVAAYNSAGKAYSILSAAGAAAESFDSVGSAVKAIGKLASDGNVMAQQFVSQGGIAHLEENAPFASNVLRDMYKSENGSELFRKEMRRMDLQNELTNAQVETEYQNIMESLQNILESDERIKLYREQLRTQKAISRQEEYAASYADFQQKGLDALMDIRDAQGNDIFDLMSAQQFNEVWMQFRQGAAQTRDPEQFNKWCEDNWNALCDLATINQIANENYRNRMGTDEGDASIVNAIYRFARLMKDSGVGDQVNTIVSNGIKAAQLFTPAPRTRP